MIWMRIAAAIFTGASQALISPPPNLTFLHWVSWIPLLWALEGVSTKRRFWLGWLSGFSALVAIFYWITGTVQRFSNLPTSLAIIVMCLFALAWGMYCGFFAMLYAPIKRWAGPAWPFAVAALLVACEFLNPQLFPFYQGVAHYQNPMLFQLASITGIRGLSFLVLLVNGLAWAGIETLVLKRGVVRSRHLVILSAVTATLFVATLLYGAVRLRTIETLEADAPTLRVGLIQLNMGIEERSQRRKENRYGILEEYLEESRNAAARGAQVVVWPEGASPYRITGKKGQEIAALASETGMEIWLGGLTVKRDPDTRKVVYHNSAFRLMPNETLGPRYDKMILLPFGEFMPGRELFPKLAAKIEGVGNFQPGEDVVVHDTEWAPFNFLICYEAIRANLVRRNVRAGSRLFVTITNDAWFGDTSCPSQHLMLTANRCTEHGIPMVRVATTGISAVVDARGMLTHQTQPYTKETMVEDVPLVYAPTLYTRIGDTFSWLCVAVMTLGIASTVRTRLRQKKAAAEDAEPAPQTPPAAEPTDKRGRKKRKKKKRRG